VHYNNFLRASAKHGRSAFEKIAKDVGRPLDEVRRYADVFWKRGSKLLSSTEWDRVVKQIEKVNTPLIFRLPLFSLTHSLTHSLSLSLSLSLPILYQGEKRLEEIQRLTSATAKLIMMFNDPWEELTFRNVGNQGRIFNAVEDRFLLCLTHLHG
jgi:SWI/SNF-related matrix-associated actin-dependent regulator of chromatin subfamily A member 5